VIAQEVVGSESHKVHSAITCSVEDVRVTLHPGQFADAVYTTTTGGRELKLTMGKVELDSYREG